VHADDIFRGIGKFAVKFRWVVLIAWIVAAVAIPRELPSLASVTQGNNSAFLPASAPSEKATNLAAPLGISLAVTPVPVVAAVTTGSFSAADQAWLGTLATDLGKVATVTKVSNLGESTVPGPHGVAGQAAQLQVLSTVSQSDQGAQTTLVKSLRSTITAAGPPAGMQVHLAGQLAINVDQQNQSGNTGNEVQDAAFVFILILLLLIFRSLLAPVHHRDPRAAVRYDRRADHRRAREPRAQGLLALAAAAHRARPRRRHRLRPLPGVPGAGAPATRAKSHARLWSTR
jgi:RND superfamily putative drug exporter